MGELLISPACFFFQPLSFLEKTEKERERFFFKVILMNQTLNFHLSSEALDELFLRIQAEPRRRGILKLTLGSDCKGRNHNLSMIIIHNPPTPPALLSLISVCLHSSAAVGDYHEVAIGELVEEGKTLSTVG